VHALNTKRSFYPEKSHVKRAASVWLRAVGAEGGGGRSAPKIWADQFTLFKPEGRLCPLPITLLLALPLRFLDLPAAM
jgi:hypothetical protein